MHAYSQKVVVGSEQLLEFLPRAPQQVVLLYIVGVEILIKVLNQRRYRTRPDHQGHLGLHHLP